MIDTPSTCTYLLTNLLLCKTVFKKYTAYDPPTTRGHLSLKVSERVSKESQ